MFSYLNDSTSTEIYTITPDLNLRIITANEFDVSVRQPTRQISGLVQFAIGIVAEWVWNEFLFSKATRVEVSARNTWPPDVYFSGNPGRDKFAARVEHIYSCSRDWLTQRDCRRSFQPGKVILSYFVCQ